MKLSQALMAATLATTSLAASAVDYPINITGPELGKLDYSRTDAGLRPVEGVKTSIVIKADKEHPETSDGLGWTYHHHPDLAVWKGRLYVGWNSCEKDEDTWPSRELLSTSTDGEHWSKPTEMFPMGVSTPLRMYFYLASNGRMLVIAGLRLNHEPLKEENKGPLVVREIKADHTLGPVYTLQAPPTPVENQPASYETAPDLGFQVACKLLLDDHLYLEQQDYGNLLKPEDRIRWHDLSQWKAGQWELNAAKDWGKATCFFRRADGALVAVGKKRWVTISQDDGKTWTQPIRPPSLITNMGKVWGQRLPNGQYMLAYNPDLKFRYPIAVVTSPDGITFSHMRTLTPEIPDVRYPGKFKSRGVSYMRGLSLWSNDGSRPNDPVWLVYSLNKEEIWVSSIPR